MDFGKEIAELREKIKSNRGDADGDKFELCQREIRNELLLKRDQVAQLRKELDNANIKIFELNRQLEINKSVLRETDFNLKLALHKSTTAEEKLREIHEAYSTLQLKEDMRMSETKILNENLQRVSLEKQRLSQEVEELKDKLKYSRAFQDDLEDRQCKINALLAKNKENNEKFETEHKKIQALDKKLQSVEDLKNMCQRLTQENMKLKNAYTELENSFIENSAKFETLNTLITRQRNANQINVLEKIKFLQWEGHFKKLKEKNLEYEEIIAKLNETLNGEINANAKLILENEEYENRISEMEKKFAIIKLEKEVNENNKVIEIE